MTKLSFKELSFENSDKGLKVNFLRNFYFYLDDDRLSKLGKYAIEKNSIEFPNVHGNGIRTKFDFLLAEGFRGMKNRLNNKPTIYIHRSSGIPLIGSNYFGIIDRGTNVIEVKPLTSCNLGCVYCSVDEGPRSKRAADFVVEKDYLAEEFEKVAKFKGIDDIDAHINAQGEPLLYTEMTELVKDLMSIKGVKTGSIDTNGTLLTRHLVDELADAGLTRINLSLNALDPKIAQTMAGWAYNLDKVLDIARYIPKKMDLIIVPVWLPGYNDEELPKLAKFAKEIGAGKNCPSIGIQNFLNYRFGRNPVKEQPMEQFYAKITELEQRHGISLRTPKEAFNVHEAKELLKPFRKGQVVEAKIMLPGRLRNEKLAVANGRVIAIPNCFKEEGKMVRLKIRRTKHNIFIGELLSR
ncbi:radical SAM protein [Candidatus Woesearchaeota archaeon]|nr:radical SAM protein [Candidatus Woesearchaeota archaeon]